MPITQHPGGQVHGRQGHHQADNIASNADARVTDVGDRSTKQVVETGSADRNGSTQQCAKTIVQPRGTWHRQAPCQCFPRDKPAYVFT
ncbi:hypothetical protein D3C76_1021720 [compost metagenome]